MKHECEICGEKVEEEDLLERHRRHEGRIVHVYWVCWECHLCYERSTHNNQTWFANYQPFVTETSHFL